MKKVELIAPEEIATAIKKVVADSFGMDRGEVPAAVLHVLLGFRRTREVARGQVMQVLDGMVARGELIQEGNHVSLPD
jgi:hypothetical protein